MKKLLSTILFVPALAIADSSIVSFESYCLTLEKLTEVLLKHDEHPMLTFTSHRGKDRQSMKQHSTVMFVNAKTLTYTIAEKINEDLFCVTSVGGDVRPYIEKESNENM